MSFAVSIRKARLVMPGLWRAAVDPAHVRILGVGTASLGNVSVLLLTDEPDFDSQSKLLSFDPQAVHVLNVGATEDAVIVLGSHDGIAAGAQHQSTSLPSTTRAGDSLFLEQLSPALKDLGAAFLHSVRKHFRGSLVFHPRSGKFVESPDNFWTVRIQPRDRSLRITVRGRPEAFSRYPHIELKADMGSYSNFKVSDMHQVPEAVEVIRVAATR